MLRHSRLAILPLLLSLSSFSVAETVATPNPATLELARSLSRPDAARAVPLFAAFDRTPRSRADLLAPLAQAYPDGDAGSLEVARRVEAARNAILASASPNFYAHEFTDAKLQLSQLPAGAPNIHLDLDTRPVEALLDLLASKEQDPARIIARLQKDDVREVYAALIVHRSQSFYGTPMSWELLAQNIAFAGSDAPLQRLYAEAQPFAFLHFAEARRYLPQYRALIKEIRQNKSAMLGYVTATIRDYIPANVQIERKVSLTICDGADGWASGGIAGVSLEYFKNDYQRMLDLMAHETYHAAQAAVARKTEVPADPLLAIWHRALERLFGEGTATYVSPPRSLSEAEIATRVKRAQALMVELEKAVFVAKDRTAAQQLQDESVQGSGPIYWLGREMSAAIVADGGKAALGKVLEQGPEGFIQAYLGAERRGQRAGLLPASVLRRLSTATKE